MTGTPKHNAAVTDVLVRLEAQLKAARTHLAYVRRIEATDSYAAAEESVEIWATLYDAVDDGQLEWRRPAQAGAAELVEARAQVEQAADEAKYAAGITTSPLSRTPLAVAFSEPGLPSPERIARFEADEAHPTDAELAAIAAQAATQTCPCGCKGGPDDCTCGGACRCGRDCLVCDPLAIARAAAERTAANTPHYGGMQCPGCPLCTGYADPDEPDDEQMTNRDVDPEHVDECDAAADAYADTPMYDGSES